MHLDSFYFNLGDELAVFKYYVRVFVILDLKSVSIDQYRSIHY